VTFQIAKFRKASRHASKLRPHLPFDRYGSPWTGSPRWRPF